jgi:hypothetical protein
MRRPFRLWLGLLLLGVAWFVAHYRDTQLGLLPRLAGDAIEVRALQTQVAAAGMMAIALTAFGVLLALSSVIRVRIKVRATGHIVPGQADVAALNPAPPPIENRPIG